jgi:hypothetical protein
MLQSACLQGHSAGRNSPKLKAHALFWSGNLDHISLGFLAPTDTCLYVTENVIMQINFAVKFSNLYFLNSSKRSLAKEKFSIKIIILSLYSCGKFVQME